MAVLTTGEVPVYVEETNISVLALATTVLRWRRIIIALGIIGAGIGIAEGLTSPRLFRSSAIFLPQGSGGQTSGLAAAASQFGIRVPTSGGSEWGPPMYVQLLKTRALLEPITRDTFTVAELGGRKMPLMDLLKIGPGPEDRRLDAAVGMLTAMITPTEVPELNGVNVTVRSPWPSVSAQLADRLVERVNVFNLDMRRTQAAGEREFVQIQSADAERSLRDAEDKLQDFLQANRAVNSPELSFQHERLQRAVALRQQVYTSLLQSLADARLREARNLPVITMLEKPRVPEVAESRQTGRKGLIGGLIGAALGLLLAVMAHALSGMRSSAAQDKDAAAFFETLNEATPRLLRRGSVKVLVTGHAGFIGFHTARRLLERGDSVVGVDIVNDYYDPAIKHARLAMLAETAARTGGEYVDIRADLADQPSVQAVFAAHAFDRVIHLAAQAGVRYSLVNPHAYIQSNIVAFTNVLEACRYSKTAHLTYASTSSVYGASTAMPFREDEPADHPIQFYAATKRANELMAHSYSHLFRLPTTALRFFTVYGPWGRPDMALFLFTKNILAGLPIQLFNQGQHTRDFTFVEDIVEGVIRASDDIAAPDPEWNSARPNVSTSSAPFRVFNIGNSQPVKLFEYVEALEAELGVRANKEFLPLQPGDVPDTLADVSALEKQLGYRPRTPVREGVARFVRWYREYYRQ